MPMNDLVYGKNPTGRIVSIEPGLKDECVLFIQDENGNVSTKTVPMAHWILFSERHSDKMKQLKGDQHYGYYIDYDNKAKWREILDGSRAKKFDHWVCRNGKEAFMLRYGYTYFKGLKPRDVSVLSFDIETTGLKHNADSKVLLISNTFRDSNGVVTRKLFSIDEHESEAAMLDAWCFWVNTWDPSIILGHNVFGFDLPYLNFCANKAGTTLKLGRDFSEIRIDHRTSLFRKDGSQAYDYNNVHVYGREIVDTMFLSFKYDIGRNYESYGLKAIIQHEGLEREDRQHYDAGTIAKNWDKPKERAKIKEYAIHDADDALALYDLMIPSFFYYTQSIPRSLQQVINTATGSQLNGLMVRAFLQSGHSIASGNEKAEYEGAISFSVPGIHKNVFKIDVKSLYPSIIIQYGIYNKQKDPNGVFLKLVTWFTEERLRNKKLAKETGNRDYTDLEQAQKIVINSMYGFLGAPRLNYNYPEGAALITKYGREILKQAIKWATGKESHA